MKKLIDDTLGFLRSRRIAYRVTFGRQNGHAQAVLRDLTQFCHWGATPFTPDPRETDVMIGRQQVLLRIKQHLGLSDEQLFAVYNGSPVPSKVDDEEDDVFK